MFKKLFLFFCITLPVTVFGIDSYTTLAPIPNVGSSVSINGGSGLSSYLNNIYILGISLCTGLAVLMIVIGGIEYMGSGSWSGKDEGKERIKAALLGLLVALGSWVILNTLDTRFLNTNLNVQQADTSGAQAGGVITPPADGNTNDAGNTPSKYTSDVNAPLTQTPDGGWANTPQKVAIDTDGSGLPPYNDPSRQPTTSYRNPDGTYLNANTDNYVVVPDGPNSPPLGTKVLITNNINGKTAWGIVGDHGPSYGEMSLHAAVQVGASNGKADASTVPNGSITYTFYK